MLIFVFGKRKFVRRGISLKDKKLIYQELISDVEQYYKSQEAAHNNEPVYLTWYNDCKEINLWTYWQGRGSLNAKIMLVGQDWGSPADAADEYIAQFAEINAGSRSSFYLDGASITDNNLIKLFSSIGYDISSGAPWNPDLFFTNFVLGYRNKGFSGSFQVRWLNENKRFFFRLVNIIEPRVIICLGRHTFHGVMMAFERKEKIENYNAFVTGKDNPVEIALSSGQQAYVFAEAHCGAMGTLNRNRHKDPTGIDGIALQEKDWARIKACMEGMRE